MRSTLCAVMLGMVLLCCREAAKGLDAGPAEADQPKRPNTTTFTRGPGGDATTKLGYGIAVNPKSSLVREWITAHDTTLPVQLVGTVGVKTIYSGGGGYTSEEYQYTASVPIVARDSLSALEIRFILFDIWGNFVKTLTSTQVEDIPAGAEPTFSPKWRIWDENEVSEHYASIAYVARVRTADGRVFDANLDPIVAEAQKISGRFTPEDLEPNRPAPRDSAARTRR